MDILKKLWQFLSALPAFASIFQKAKATGKIDPLETLDALSNLSRGTKRVSDVAMNVTQNGGNIQDVAKAIEAVGEVEVMGQKVNTRTLISDLKKYGGFCDTLANILQNMTKQDPKDVVEFGKAASDIRNWQDMAKTFKQ